VTEDDDDPVSGEIICCQGPPICTRTFSDDVPGAERDRIQNACEWCKHIFVVFAGAVAYAIMNGGTHR